MLYLFDHRLIAYKQSMQSKYYMQVVSANCEHSGTVHTATFEVIATDGSVNYVANIDFDDVVWYEVSMRFSSSEKIVWKKIFEGRIVSPKIQWGNGTTATFLCVGHAHEINYTLISTSADYPSTTDSLNIVTGYNSLLSRITIKTRLESTFQTAYVVKADQKYLKDVLDDIEDLGGHGYFFELETTYNSKGYVGADLYYKQVPQTVTPKLKIIGNTSRLISANFEADGGEMYNYIIQKGATPSGGAQYTGTASDSTSITRYGKRMLLETDNSLNNNELCAALASGKLPLLNNPIVKGSVEILGSPDVKYNDLIFVFIGQIKMNGAILWANLRVRRVTHNVSRNGYTTYIEFGTLQKSTSDYFAEFARRNRLTNSQFVT